MGDVTQILHKIEQGDRHAGCRLLPLIYDELRRLAAARMAAESPDHTLQPTALVHEAYMRLVGPGDDADWESRGHFFAAASQAMRRILVETARRKRTAKHGAGRQRLDLDPDYLAAPESSTELLAIDESLDRLAEEYPEIAKLVELRYFAGLTMKETVAALGVPPRTADRHWAFAKAWLYRELQSKDER